MSRRAVDAVFQGLFALTDVRVILRRTAPLHEITGDDRRVIEERLADLRRQAAILEEELLR
ncbi:MAG: hypothetical protein LUQ23_03515 [Methanomicrobiales archaeon]|nr:hypothetical protein [Methanomicrobiales archaeon]MDD1670773.1 hypothetical protein [Methanomicrobiales archaeon]